VRGRIKGRRRRDFLRCGLMRDYKTVSKPSVRRTRVKLRRVNADFSEPYPPDGDQKRWWAPLRAAWARIPAIS